MVPGRSDADGVRRARPARLSDVAAAAGVSVTTVSYVLNNPDRVRATTAARVRKVLQELDYLPHDTAVTLRTGSSRTVGLVLPDVTNAFYARLARGAAGAAQERRYSLVLCDSADDADREDDYFSVLAEQRAAGAVVVPLSADTERLERLRRRGVRLVLLDRAAASSWCCSVSVDDVRGGGLALEHLMAQGHRRIAVLNGPPSIRQCADRFAGASAVAHAAGVDLVHAVVPHMTTPEGEAAARELLAGAERPTAVFATNDQLAIGVLQAVGRRGLHSPDDVAVVGYGDLDIAPYAPVPLSTVAQPLDAMGRAAIEMMFVEIDEGDTHEHRGVSFTPRLVRRASA